MRPLVHFPINLSSIAVFIAGPSLLYVRDPAERLQRMPSGMVGDKITLDPYLESTGTEGSLRNFLAVWGPGVSSGGVNDVLLSLADILPTIAELAGAEGTTHEPWVSSSSSSSIRALGRQQQQHVRPG
uniref:Uncharacterized protein n=1 Tax=Tetradesmus obliquus TaxID=3088 RepID=A0A383WNT5_TETOB|eukprot:jgi/Sobl393_1/18569/SZX78824.1